MDKRSLVSARVYTGITAIAIVIITGMGNQLSAAGLLADTAGMAKVFAIVKYEEDFPASQLAKHNAEVSYRVDDYKLVEIKIAPDSLSALNSENGITYAVQEPEHRIPDPILTGANILTSTASTYTFPDGSIHEYRSWGIDKMQVQKAWEQEITGRSVKVAVIDTGVDPNHPYLKNNIDMLVGTCRATAFNNAGGPNDDHGHGTHVAGIVKQVAPDARIYSIKRLNNDGSSGGCMGTLQAVDLAAKGPDGIKHTADDADIISMSLGGPVISGPLFGKIGSIVNPSNLLGQDTYEPYFDDGYILVAASGNGVRGANVGFPGSIHDPAAHKKIIAVAALGEISTNGYDSASDLVASYSSDGITDGNDGWVDYFEIDTIAPGSNIVSTLISGDWGRMSGTSMATPHISGMLALILQKNPEFSPQQARERLWCVSEDLVMNGKFTHPGYDVSSGYGLPKAPNLISGRCLPKDPGSGASKIGSRLKQIINETISSSEPEILPISESKVRANGNDSVYFYSTFNRETFVLIAPDGSSLTAITDDVQATYRVFFDGRVLKRKYNSSIWQPAAEDLALTGSLNGVPADGTWTYKNNLTLYGEPGGVQLEIQGKIFDDYEGSVSDPTSTSGSPSGSSLFHKNWNWHKQIAPTHITHVASAASPEEALVGQRFFRP